MTNKSLFKAVLGSGSNREISKFLIWAIVAGRAWVKIDPHELEILRCISVKCFRSLIQKYRKLLKQGGLRGDG